MPLAIQSLSQLTQADYNTALALVQQLVQSAHPDFDLYGGVLAALLLNPAAVLEAANQDNINRIIEASSFQALAADPTLTDSADENVVSNLASNYRVTQITGAASTGSINVVLTAQTAVVVPAGTVFNDATGNTYSTLLPFNAKILAADVISDTDRLLFASALGTWTFTIDVTADVIGSAGNIARGSVTSTTIQLTNYARSYAANDFTGGLDAETITALINRVHSSWAASGPSTRTGLEGLFRAQTGYATLIAVSTLGFGDAEQRRNHSILPIAMPGRVDSYVRTQGPWESILKNKTALLVGSSSGHGIWQITLTRDDAPIYQLDKVTLPVNANSSITGYTINSRTRGYDVSTGTTPSTIFLPDITSAAEAAYSRYQTLTFTFTDTDTSLSGLVIGVSTATYSVAYRSLPGITTLQDAVAVRGARSTMGDCLVKAPIPIFVTLTITIDHAIGSTAVDTAAVAAAIEAAVNVTGFVGTLSASLVIAAAQTVLTAGSQITGVTLNGTLVRADGTNVALTTSNSGLTFSTDNADMVSSRTCCFFISVGNITVTVVDITTPES